MLYCSCQGKYYCEGDLGVGGGRSAVVGGGFWFSRTSCVARWERVPLRPEGKDGPSDSNSSFSLATRKGKWEMNTVSVVCKKSMALHAKYQLNK